MTLQGARRHLLTLSAGGLWWLFLASDPGSVSAHRLLLSTGDDVSQCVDRETLEQRVHAALTTTSRYDLELRVDIRLEEGAFKLTLVVFDEGGLQLTRRDLVSHSPNCRDLDETLVLVSALILDGAVAEQRVRMAEAREQRWSVGLSAGGVFRVLPSAYADGGLVVGFRRGRMLMLAGASLGQIVETPAREGTMELRALAGGLTLCGALLHGRAGGLGPCGNLVVGQLRATTEDLVVENTTRRAPHVRVGAGLVGELALGRHIGLVTSAMLELAVTRTTFAVSQGGTARVVHQLPWVGVRLDVALMVRLGPAD